MIPENLDTLLDRKQTAAALTRAGFPIAPETLATKATRGGGPEYKLFGRKPLYRWGDALEWAKGRMRYRSFIAPGGGSDSVTLAIAAHEAA